MFSTSANVRENARELASVGIMFASPSLLVMPSSVISEGSVYAAADAELRRAEIWFAAVINEGVSWPMPKSSVRTSPA